MNNKEEAPDFDSLFEFSSGDEEYKHEARMIMYRFLSEIERTAGKKRGLKTTLADAVGKSKSYITQLFRGDRLINLLMLAKFQKALGIKFKIIAYTEEDFNKNTAQSKLKERPLTIAVIKVVNSGNTTATVRNDKKISSDVFLSNESILTIPGALGIEIQDYTLFK